MPCVFVPGVWVAWGGWVCAWLCWVWVLWSMFGNERKNKVSDISSIQVKFQKKIFGNFSKQVYVQYKIFFFVQNMYKI